jgi:hypothetical protein
MTGPYVILLQFFALFILVVVAVNLVALVLRHAMSVKIKRLNAAAKITLPGIVTED